jgi:hypothetical protein
MGTELAFISAFLNLSFHFADSEIAQSSQAVDSERMLDSFLTTSAGFALSLLLSFPGSNAHSLSLALAPSCLLTDSTSLKTAENDDQLDKPRLSVLSWVGVSLLALALMCVFCLVLWGSVFRSREYDQMEELDAETDLEAEDESVDGTFFVHDQSSNDMDANSIWATDSTCIAQSIEELFF